MEYNVATRHLDGENLYSVFLPWNSEISRVTSGKIAPLSGLEIWSIL